MMLSRLIHQYPVLTYAALSLSTGIFILLLERVGAGYDDGGVGTLAFLLGSLWAVVAFPFYLSSELLLWFTDGSSVPGHWFVAGAMGLVGCIVGEAGVRYIRRRRPRANS